MAKRAKAAKAAQTAEAKAKIAKPEPFYRPFSKIKAAEKKKPPAPTPASPASPAKHAPAESAGTTAKPATSSKRTASSPPHRAEEAAPPALLDADTFALYMSGVRALPDNRAHRIPANASRIERAAPSVLPQEDPDSEARARMRSLVSEGIRFETVDDGDRIEGRKLDVDPRDLRRLRRGQYAIDGKLDLHGLGAHDARQAVESFVKKRATDGDRVVLIVHGKGSHSPRGHAVLRGEIAAWLSQGRVARHVAAFATAPDHDGGTGAVLVLLAR